MIENTDAEQVERLNSRIAELLREVETLRSAAQGMVTDAMVKAGAAAMCCQAQTLGCAANNKDSEFSICMMSSFMEDARRCLGAALAPADGKTP